LTLHSRGHEEYNLTLSSDNDRGLKPSLEGFWFCYNWDVQVANNSERMKCLFSIDENCCVSDLTALAD
jgi:hypothetical protein